MTFEQWWKTKKSFLRRSPGLCSDEQVQLLCHEAWLIAMDQGQVDDARQEDEFMAPDICGICRHPREQHLLVAKPDRKFFFLKRLQLFLPASK